MRNLTLIIGLLLLIINVMLGLILSSYSTFNMGLNSAVIAAHIGLLCAVSAIQLKDGFRYSLNCLFIGMGFVEFILGLFAPERFEDNGFLVFVLFMLLLEVVLLLGANYISKTVK